MVATADPECIKEWKSKAMAAQAKRHKDIKAMDYFAVNIKTRKYRLSTRCAVTC